MRNLALAISIALAAGIATAADVVQKAKVCGGVMTAYDRLCRAALRECTHAGQCLFPSGG